jgi:deoxyribose-phosphate aldolase
MGNSQSMGFNMVVDRIDYFLIEPQLSERETLDGCSLANRLHIKSLFIKPCYVKQGVNALRASQVSVGTVVGFPFGANTTHVKVAEVKRALTEGATSIEMVINVGYLKDLTDDLVRRDICAVCGIAHMNGGKVNVIIPIDQLTTDEIHRSAIIAKETGVNGITFISELSNKEQLISTIKSVTGAVGSQINIKVMGNEYSRQHILDLIEAGCNRIGVNDLEIFFGLFQEKV